MLIRLKEHFICGKTGNRKIEIYGKPVKYEVDILLSSKFKID
jgi:hypothetical protein